MKDVENFGWKEHQESHRMDLNLVFKEKNTLRYEIKGVVTSGQDQLVK